MALFSNDDCPYCRYSLRGLPRPHHCPECGRAYDELTCAWRPPGIWNLFRSVGFTRVAALSALVNWCMMLFVQRTPPMHWATVAVIIMLPCAIACSTILGVRVLLAGRVAAITPDGVLLRDGVRMGVVSWSELPEVRVTRGSLLPSFMVSIRTKGRSGRVTNTIFDTLEEAVQFQKAVEAARERYTGPDAGDQRTPLP
jgi:hypothetical protein